MDLPFQGWDWVIGSGMAIMLLEERTLEELLTICQAHWNPGGEQSSGPRCASWTLGQVVKGCFSYSGAKETKVKRISKQRSQPVGHNYAGELRMMPGSFIDDNIMSSHHKIGHSR